MKKAIILSGVLLLPILVSAYQLDEDLTNMANKISNQVAQAVTQAVDQNQADSRQDKIDRIKDIISDAKHSFDSSYWGASGGTSGGAASTNLLSRQKYYKVSEITENLANENLDTFLKNDKAALNEVADYVTDHYYYTFHNDFQALRAIGVDYIDAAIRTKDDEFVQISATKHDTYGNLVSITYLNCYIESFVGTMSGGTSPVSEQVKAIVGNFTQEQVEALQEQGYEVIIQEVTDAQLAALQPKEESNNNSNIWEDPYIKSVFEGFSVIEKAGK